MTRITLLTLLVSTLVGVPSSAQSPVGSDFQVNTYTTAQQYSSSVARSDNGYFLVVWHSQLQDGDGDGIYGQFHSSDGQRQGVEFRINTYTTGDQRNSTVSTSPFGFVVAWSDLARTQVSAQRLASDGLLIGAEIAVNTNPDFNGFEPSMAVNSSGRFLISWSNVNGSTIYSRLFAADGAPINGTQVAVNSNTSFDNNSSQVLAMPSGDFRVVWTETDFGGGFGPGSQTSWVNSREVDSNGNPMGSEILINSSTTGIAHSPAIVQSANGFTVVWNSDTQIDSSGQLTGQRFLSSGAKIGTEFQVNEYTTSTQMFPQLSTDGNGGFVVVWNDSNNTPPWSRINGRHFDEVATPTSTFQVNTTTHTTYHPAVDSASDGAFIVTWDSADRDGDGLGIFGRQYTSDHIFSDDFESGDLTKWSATEPPIDPPGDDCTAPYIMGDTIPSSGDLGNNTASGVIDSCGVGNTIDEWHTYLAPCNGTVTITTCRPATVFDTILSAWDSCGGLELDCNDDDPQALPECDLGGNNRKSTLTFSVTSGNSYLIRVSAFNDDLATGSAYEMTAVCQ